jgi:hypothetical protein
MYIFTPNTLIKSQEVNDNFDDLYNGMFADGSILATKMASRERIVTLPFHADQTGGAVASNDYSDGMVFTGTPTNYVRSHARLPIDWVAGTDFYFLLKLLATNSRSNQPSVRYVSAWDDGDVFTPSFWNIESAVSTNDIFVTANTLKQIPVLVAGASLTAGDLVTIAWRPDFAITGSLYVLDISLYYESKP